MKQGRVDPLDIVLHEVHNVKETTSVVREMGKEKKKKKKGTLPPKQEGNYRKHVYLDCDGFIAGKVD